MDIRNSYNDSFKIKYQSQKEKIRIDRETFIDITYQICHAIMGILTNVLTFALENGIKII